MEKTCRCSTIGLGLVMGLAWSDSWLNSTVLKASSNLGNSVILCFPSGQVHVFILLWWTCVAVELATLVFCECSHTVNLPLCG